MVVGEAASIHTARYVSMLKKNGYDVCIFSNASNSHQDDSLKNTLIYVGGEISSPARNGNILMIPVFSFFVSSTEKTPSKIHQLLKIPARYLSIRSAAKNLSSVINAWAPDLVISLKMQDDGYAMSEARALSKDGGVQPPWVHFIWGTDIEFFGKAADYKDEHLPKIKALLSRCDYIIADTYRDLESSKALGFKGMILGKQIAQGGFDIGSVFQKNQRGFDDRDIILVKGRQGGLIGKAMSILDALHELKDDIKYYKIKIMMATPDVKARAHEYSRADNVFYDCLDRLDHNELMDVFSRSRITISATDVDGTPGFLLETMAMGALPVHSNMESIREWIDHGQNGLLFPVDDKEALKQMILKGLSDKSLFDAAQKHNFMLAKEQMDEKKIQEQTDSMIRQILFNDHNNQQKDAA